MAFPAGETAPKELVEYFKQIKGLDYTDKPDYAKLRTIFEAASREAKVRKSDLFQTAGADEPAGSPKKRPVKAKTSTSNGHVDVANDHKEVAKKTRVAPKKTTSTTAAAPSSNGSLVDLAKLPPGQRRKVVAASAAHEASTSLAAHISTG